MGKTVIVSGARTPFGKFGGSLHSLKAAELGARAIQATLARKSLEKCQIDGLIIGNVLQGGQGQIPSRQASVFAGLPDEVPTETINKVCASGMRSVTLADQMIRLGDATTMIAGGMESMSQAPYIVESNRWGKRMGHGEIKDLMIHDGLTCSFTNNHMGVYGNEVAIESGITREQQDEWALRSHHRALEAIENGKMAEEIAPVTIKQRKGDDLEITTDEAPRKNTTIEALQSLPSIFSKDGTITAGNAPGVNDGAAALLLMNEETAEKQGLAPLATIVGHTSLAVHPKDFPKTPGLVINKLLQKTGKRKEDISLFEINEAFAAVALVSAKIANLDLEKINVNGGAVALGHPIGASGTRIILTLAYELQRRGGGLGIAAICSGGGQGDAIMIEV